jgi:hypothetical protein
VEYPVLVNHLEKEMIPLAVCPQLNIGCVFLTRWKNTLHYGHYNYQSIVLALRLTATDVLKMAENGIVSSFLSAEAYCTSA